MRALALPPLLLLLSGPARAADRPEPAHYVDLSPLALPIIVQHRVRNYIFVYVRLHLTKQADPTIWQDKEPYFRDALVRAGHRTPFTRGNDYTMLDDAKLKAAMYSAATAIAGAGNVASVTILSETPKSRSGFPRPKAPGAR